MEKFLDYQTIGAFLATLVGLGAIARKWLRKDAAEADVAAAYAQALAAMRKEHEAIWEDLSKCRAHHEKCEMEMHNLRRRVDLLEDK